MKCGLGGLAGGSLVDEPKVGGSEQTPRLCLRKSNPRTTFGTVLLLGQPGGCRNHTVHLGDVLALARVTSDGPACLAAGSPACHSHLAEDEGQIPPYTGAGPPVTRYLPELLGPFTNDICF